MKYKYQFSIFTASAMLGSVLLWGCGGSAKSGSSGNMGGGSGGSVDASTIAGTLVDGSTHQSLSNIAVVAIEQKDNLGIDRVVMATVADSSGRFTLHPVPPGTYDLVANASLGAGTQYSANVTTGVQPGTDVGSVPLIPPSSNNGAQSGANISGEVDSAGSSVGVNATVTLTALQHVGSVLATIPQVLQSGTSVSVTTAPSTACPAGSNCANYTLLVPGQNPNVGAFSASGTTYAQAPGEATYIIDGKATAVGSSTADCNPSELQVNMLAGGGTITVAPGGIATASSMQFSGCQ